MRSCIVCGCTDVMACHGGCSWLRKIGKNRGVCTSCPPPAKASHMTKEQRAKRAELSAAVKRSNVRRRQRAKEYMRADEDYFNAVLKLRRFEAGVPL